jgi:hypothetical protein
MPVGKHSEVNKPFLLDSYSLNENMKLTLSWSLTGRGEDAQHSVSDWLGTNSTPPMIKEVLNSYDAR